MTIRTCLLATIAVTVLATTTFADSPFDKFLPRGRLLRKLRDDVMGPPEPKEPTPATKPNANQKGPTPAVRPTGQQRPHPQATNNRGSQQQRPQANRQSQPKRPTTASSGADGFGMAVVIDKKDNIIVAQVSPKGNAAEAGLQRGDVIVEAGGVELTSIEEYQEIAKMLSAGDQLDLKVARRGKPSTVTLQYGQPPSLEDVEVGEVNSKTGNASAGSKSPRTSSAASGYRNDFSFVPPADDDSRPGMRSVVERSAAPVHPASTQQRAMGQLRSNRPAAPPRQLQQTVSQQQQQIQLLQQQLEQLRRQQGMTGSGLRTQRGSR